MNVDKIDHREYAVMLCECVCSLKLLYSLTSSNIMMSKRINYSGKIVGYLFVLYFCSIIYIV